VRLAVEVQARVEARELLMEAARRLPPDFIAARFAGADEKLSPAPLEANGLKLSPSEAFVLSRVDAPIALVELAAISGMPEPDTLQALYALVLGGLLSRETGARAFTSEQLARARSVKKTQARVAAPAASPVESTPAPDPVVEATQPPAGADSKPNEVELLFARLSEAENYYHVLDLSRDAAASEIKRAYHTLAKRFHPDRFHKDTEPSVYARIEDAFARISQAYETLKDQRTRAAYDRALGPPVTPRQGPSSQSKQDADVRAPEASAARTGPTPPPTQPRPRATTAQVRPEEIYQQGVSALQQGSQSLALSYLGEAARLEPKQARYRAQYGRALAAGAQTRHQAEAEFQAAISLDKNNVYYRVMLARLYSDMGMVRRAQSELERALAIDPQSQAARAMLDKLRSKG
jgi:curved DNA-binding protein CbpA